ncbi:MAG: hypothetical protein ABIR62_03620 [Dokdonella sp.]|uniref:hypothetical protein n=1 Tax=Dokdonella sp. TaxID=2291710 RepID=UPI0032630BBA
MRVTPPGDPLQRRKSQVIAAVFGVNLAFGIIAVLTVAPQAAIDAVQPTVMDPRVSPLGLAYQVVWLTLCFVWLGLDAQQLQIRRPWWLNIGIALAALVFFPYYLYKTRAPGKRAQAIMNSLGVVLGGIVAMSIGMSLAIAMSARA